MPQGNLIKMLKISQEITPQSLKANTKIMLNLVIPLLDKVRHFKVTPTTKVTPTSNPAKEPEFSRRNVSHTLVVYSSTIPGIVLRRLILVSLASINIVIIVHISQRRRLFIKQYIKVTT